MSRVSDQESFARLIFCGVTQLLRPEQEVWLMPLGHLLDQREIYEQLQGWKKPKQEFYIDSILRDIV